MIHYDARKDAENVSYKTPFWKLLSGLLPAFLMVQVPWAERFWQTVLSKIKDKMIKTKKKLSQI
jgi:hypothetical protein